MHGSHGVCDCDILRRANVKADLYLLRGGFVRTLRTPPGYGHDPGESYTILYFAPVTPILQAAHA